METMTDRPKITTLETLAILDSAEIVAGYHDGLAGEMEPGGNRSDSYWHGWRNGSNDRARVVDRDQRALAKALTLAEAS